MKTIPLIDQAYERIAALKASPEDSFSKVILRAMPRRGTAAQRLKDIRKLPPLTRAQGGATPSASWGGCAIRRQNPE